MKKTKIICSIGPKTSDWECFKGIIMIVIFNHSSSSFVLENKEDGSMIINAKNASKDSGGIGEVTLQEGQKLEVKANLENESSINVKVIPSGTETDPEAVLNESFKQTEEREFEIPSGKYNVAVTTEKDATGSMTINIK